MFCGSCGKEIEDGAKFCTYCGAKTESKDDVINEAPPKKKKGALKWIAVGILVLVVLFIGISSVKTTKRNNEIKAVFDNALSLAEDGDFSNAYKALTEEATNPEQETIVNYINAGVLYEKGKLEDAIKAFEELDGFADSEKLIQECKDGIDLKAVEELIQSDDFEKVINKLDEMKASGSKAAEEKYDEILEKCYNRAIENYHNHEYDSAAAGFEIIKNFKDSEKYLEVIDIVNSKSLSAEQIYNKLINMLDFDGVNGIISYHGALLRQYILGEWKDDEGKTKLFWKGYVRDYMPSIATGYGGTYYLSNGSLYFYKNTETFLNAEKDKDITIIDKDHATFYNYKDGSTYTLHRK